MISSARTWQSGNFAKIVYGGGALRGLKTNIRTRCRLVFRGRKDIGVFFVVENRAFEFVFGTTTRCVLFLERYLCLARTESCVLILQSSEFVSVRDRVPFAFRKFSTV